MKTCKDCNKNKPQSDFYGLQGECKECTKKRIRENYKLNRIHYVEYEKKRWLNPERRIKALIYQREGRKRFPGKYKARMKLSNAVRSGLLLKTPCEVCQNVKSQAHHTDYRKPLKVIWLCRKHHLEIENKIAY